MLNPRSFNRGVPQQPAQQVPTDDQARIVTAASWPHETTATNPARSIVRHVSICIAVVLWMLGIGAGFASSVVYEITPSKSATDHDRFPFDSQFTLASDRPTLVMFVHPRCPCSRASMNELAVLMTHCQGRVASHVLFFQPASASADWAQTDLWHAATRIPGVTPRVDIEGEAHRRFGARVSGEVFVYLPSGELKFHGGITASRGHAGDNAGRLALESLMWNHQLPSDTIPVFGCDLQSPLTSLIPHRQSGSNTRTGLLELVQGQLSTVSPTTGPIRRAIP